MTITGKLVVVQLEADGFYTDDTLVANQVLMS